jgi:putative endonuclease
LLTPEARLLAVQRRARKRQLAKVRAEADGRAGNLSRPTKARRVSSTAAFTRTADTGTPDEGVYQSPSQREGAAQEALALAYLEAAGLQLLARNVACRVGELDLVMQDGELLVFVEVRARQSARFGGAAASVTFAKQRRLARAAEFFLKTLWKGPTPRCRFDVVAISSEEVDWLCDAFTPGYT